MRGTRVAEIDTTMPDLERHLDGRTLILVSNREPYEHVRGSHGVEVRRPPGGLVSALDPTMQRTRGVWVAWGSGDEDRAATDGAGRLRVPPEDPSYTLRRVWLDESDIDGYYLGFANSVLWPLCHMLVHHVEFRTEHWNRYRSVNRRFAAAAADEARRAEGQPLVWIQDYHFALAAGYLRELDPALFVQLFWHIPFPPPDILRLLPAVAQEAVLRGLLGNDLIGFHTDRYAQNFLACVAEMVPDGDVDHREARVRIDGRTVAVGAFPISIDVDGFEELARRPKTAERVAVLRARYAGPRCGLGIGVDRVDYTKGIPQRLRALELLWEAHPELRECLTFLLVATPSRIALRAYQELELEIVALVRRINERFSTPRWTPIR